MIQTGPNMPTQTGYRIVEVDQDGQRYRTLFHGTQGTRTLRFNEWMTADVKSVRDGNGQRYYTAGWHVCATREECFEYLKRFTAPRQLEVIEVQIRGDVWRKAHSRHPIFLAEEMFISVN